MEAVKKHKLLFGLLLAGICSILSFTPVSGQPTDLVGHWSLDENSGTMAVDSSGLGHSGTLEGGASWTTGILGSAISLDGRGGFVSLTLPNATAGRTRAAWIYAASTTDYQGIISNNDWVPGSLHFRIDNGKIASGINGGTTINAPITANAWHHVATTYDATSGAFAIYIDGLEAAATTTRTGLTVQGEDYIGNEYTDGRFFEGAIDEVRIYDRALAASEILNLFNSTPIDTTTLPDPTPDPGPVTDMEGFWRLEDASGLVASDSSGKGHTGSLMGGADWVPGKVGSAISLNGQTGYVSISMPKGTAGRTRAAWIYPTSTTGYRGIISNSDWQAGSMHFRIDNGRIVSGIYGAVSINAPITANAWHHVATTYDAATGAFYLYIDGREAASWITRTGLAIQGEDYIGNEYIDGRYFEGLIDEVRIYDRALAASEVLALYGTPTDTTTTPDPIPDPGPDPTSPIAGLVGHWHLDESTGTLAVDSSGYRRTGTLSGNTSWTAGKLANALSLDGMSGYVKLSMPNATVGRTRAAWIYPTATNSYRGIVSNNDWVPGSMHFRLDYGRVVSGINGGATLNAPISADAWHHIATTYDAATGAFYIYIDGKEAAVAVTSTGLTIQGEDYIGNEYIDGRYFQGLIDDVRVYDRALTAAEIQTLYGAPVDTTTTPDPDPNPIPTTSDLAGYWRLDEGSGTLAADSSGLGHAGSLVGNASWAAGKIGSAISLDGQGSYISLPMPNATFGRTRAAWIYATATDGLRGIISNSDWILGSWHFRIDNGRLASGINGGPTLYSPISDSTWHYVVTTYDALSGSFYLYVDGKEEASSIMRTGLTIQGEDYIGNEYTKGRFFKGIIDDVRIYDRALSALEIEALYSNTLDSLQAVTSFYASPTGSPGADGTSQKPYTLDQALAAVRTGIQTIFLKEGTYAGPHRLDYSFNPADPVIVRPDSGASVIIEGSFYRSGGGIRWQNLEFGVANWSSRISQQTGSNPTDIPDHDFNVLAKDQFINCIIHDHNNNGFWAPSEDVFVYGTLFYNQGWKGADRWHGHAAYLQNQIGTKQFKRNVFVSGFSGYTVHAYSEDNVIQGLNFEENVSIGGLWMVGGYYPISRVFIKGNHINSNLRLGFSDAVTSSDVLLQDNILLEPPEIRGVWLDLNESGTLPIGGLDRVFVYDNAYDPDRGLVVIYNASDAAAVSVDLTSLPLKVGRRYKLLNSLNPVEAFEFTYDSTAVSVPMTGWTVALPLGWDTTLVANTFPGFGTFMLAGGGGSAPIAGRAASKNQPIEVTPQQILPASFDLGVSYPNPFNSVATVPFSLPEEADVQIYVYDLLGRRVSTLVQNHFAAGQHHVMLEAANLPSGMYLIQARMKTANNKVHSFVRKVMLLK